VSLEQGFCVIALSSVVVDFNFLARATTQSPETLQATLKNRLSSKKHYKGKSQFY